jgi:hypothetical protein
MHSRTLFVALLLVAACKKDPSTTNEPDPVQPTGADPVADTSVPQADEGGAPTEPAAEGGAASEPAAGGDECVSRCVASRQMQAIAADAIKKECEADCASGKFK